MLSITSPRNDHEEFDSLGRRRLTGATMTLRPLKLWISILYISLVDCFVKPPTSAYDSEWSWRSFNQLSRNVRECFPGLKKNFCQNRALHSASTVGLVWIWCTKVATWLNSTFHWQTHSSLRLGQLCLSLYLSFFTWLSTDSIEYVLPDCSQHHCCSHCLALIHLYLSLPELSKLNLILKSSQT